MSSIGKLISCFKLNHSKTSRTRQRLNNDITQHKNQVGLFNTPSMLQEVSLMYFNLLNSMKDSILPQFKNCSHLWWLVVVNFHVKSLSHESSWRYFWAACLRNQWMFKKCASPEELELPKTKFRCQRGATKASYSKRMDIASNYFIPAQSWPHICYVYRIETRTFKLR